MIQARRYYKKYFLKILNRLGSARWAITFFLSIAILLKSYNSFYTIYKERMHYKQIYSNFKPQIATDKKRFANLEQKKIRIRQQEINQKLKKLIVPSLTHISHLLFEQALKYSITIVTYSLDPFNQKEHTMGNNLIIQGSYENILQFCTKLHDEYPYLQCDIKSLNIYLPESTILEAHINLLLYHD